MVTLKIKVFFYLGGRVNSPRAAWEIRPKTMAVTQPPQFSGCTNTCLQKRTRPPVPPRRGLAAVLTVALLAVRPQLVAQVTGTLEGAPSVETPVCTHG